MSAHLPHPERNEAKLPLLFDGCARCEEQAADLGINLDQERWRAAWQQMLRVEYDDVGAYLSLVDRQLGRSLYHMSLILQRQGLDPRALFA